MLDLLVIPLTKLFDILPEWYIPVDMLFFPLALLAQWQFELRHG